MDKRTNHLGFTEIKRAFEKVCPEQKGKLISQCRLKQGREGKVEPINLKVPGNNNNDSSTMVDSDDEEDIMSVLEAVTLRAMEANTHVKTEQDLDCREVLACAASTQGYTITGAKTAGSFQDDLKTVVTKHLKHGHIFDATSVATCCFDGARMNDNPVNPINITSYNLGVISAAMTKHCSLADSNFILTFMQILGPENIGNVLPVLKDWGEAMSKARANPESFVDGCVVEFINMNDLSMLYKLLGCVGSGSLLQCYPLCKCNKGEAVGNDNHVCVLITNKEQEEGYAKSLAHYETLTGTDELKKKALIKIWSKQFNFGITHYGLPPSMFPLDSIIPDTFHLCSALAKKFMNSVREFINKRGRKNKKLFGNRLIKTKKNPAGFFRINHMLIWELNKSFDCFTGSELRLFTHGGAKLSEWMIENKIAPNNNLEFSSLCTALKHWTRAEHFLRIAVVETNDNRTVTSNIYASEYERLIPQFIADVTAIFDAGKHSFMKSKKGKVEGVGETAYLHTLRFYIPNMLKRMWEEHRLPFGIFTMQGKQLFRIY